MLFLIAYDLRTPGNGDAGITEALESVNAKRILRSTWALSSDASSTSGLLEYLSQHVGSDDRLLVVEVAEEAWSASNALLDLHHLHAFGARAVSALTQSLLRDRSH